MPTDVDALMKLEVPVIVVIDQRPMSLDEVTSLVPGAIVELPKTSEEELEIYVNNKQVGVGRAVKVGENFGIRVSYVGDLRDRIEALGPGGDGDDMGADNLAEQLLSGQ